MTAQFSDVLYREALLLDRGEFDGLVMAAAGLKRLGLAERIRQIIPTSVSLPSPGQGALGIEIRAADPDMAAFVAPLNDPHTRAATAAERAVSRALGGSCQVPLAAYAEIEGIPLEEYVRFVVDASTVDFVELPYPDMQAALEVHGLALEMTPGVWVLAVLVVSGGSLQSLLALRLQQGDLLVLAAASTPAGAIAPAGHGSRRFHFFSISAGFAV